MVSMQRMGDVAAHMLFPAAEKEPNPFSVGSETRKAGVTYEGH